MHEFVAKVYAFETEGGSDDTMSRIHLFPRASLPARQGPPQVQLKLEGANFSRSLRHCSRSTYVGFR
ncbi:hypothetical protein GOP47_0022767 [Adiantum capillus-veneris]|uniref:Uncharacterized protein n=1 Tax=Adiantum capillus-veneris TaxID=13818 RepID=A0A9D4Z4L3_ADICA|nr:hypothetical protein GOP47_0022767 [Adiantum capillus-veneris]